MNYRHSYHAGNFADVVKHIVLLALTQALLRKDNAFCYLDTHAGRGAYDLQSVAAQKTKEFENGIHRVLSALNPPPLVQDYITCIRTLNSDASFYPGSPFFVKHGLRPQDRMILCERHPEEHAFLKKFFRHEKKVAVHLQDGYQGLRAFLPPTEKRGFVLIDPPYENRDEFSNLILSLQKALKQWEGGCYAVWYPIKAASDATLFLKTIQQSIKRPWLTAELCIYPPEVATQLNGCGMLVINPPWVLEPAITTVFPWLHQILRISPESPFQIKSTA